ncbi:hypothetical protein L7F22_065909 [Adiantum nelumboides]|nr:hypothetical protein [Adiantum nelumboides]
MANSLLISSVSLPLVSPNSHQRLSCKASLPVSAASRLFLLQRLLISKKGTVISSQSSPEKHIPFAAHMLSGLLLSYLLLGDLGKFSIARAAGFGQDSSSEQQVAPRKGTCATCLGVVDETLGACGGTPNCVSTFDDSVQKDNAWQLQANGREIEQVFEAAIGQVHRDGPPELDVTGFWLVTDDRWNCLYHRLGNRFRNAGYRSVEDCDIRVSSKCSQDTLLGQFYLLKVWIACGRSHVKELACA